MHSTVDINAEEARKLTMRQTIRSGKQLVRKDINDSSKVKVTKGSLLSPSFQIFTAILARCPKVGILHENTSRNLQLGFSSFLK